MAWVVQASRDVDASPDEVWEALVDFAGYEAWNPFTPRVRTTLRVGDPVHLDVRLTPRRQTQSVNIVTVVSPPHHLVWRTWIGHPRLLRSVRTQTVAPLPGGRARYTTHERFDGTLSLPLRLLTSRWLQRGFDSVAAGLADHLAAETTRGARDPHTGVPPRAPEARSGHGEG